MGGKTGKEKAITLVRSLSDPGTPYKEVSTLPRGSSDQRHDRSDLALIGAPVVIVGMIRGIAASPVPLNPHRLHHGRQHKTPDVLASDRYRNLLIRPGGMLRRHIANLDVPIEVLPAAPVVTSVRLGKTNELVALVGREELAPDPCPIHLTDRLRNGIHVAVQLSVHGRTNRLVAEFAQDKFVEPLVIRILMIFQPLPVCPGKQINGAAKPGVYLALGSEEVEVVQVPNAKSGYNLVLHRVVSGEVRLVLGGERTIHEFGLRLNELHERRPFLREIGPLPATNTAVDRDDSGDEG